MPPSVAWAELGGVPLGPRGKRRLTRAMSELLFIDHALEDVTRKRGKDDPLPTPEVVVAADMIVKLYTEDQGFDMAAALEDDTPEDAE